MVLEIERKFVLDAISAIKTLKDDGILIEQNEITQIYTKITPLEEIRFRKSGQNFTTAHKIGKGLMRKENENECSEKEFKTALKHALGMPINKTRFEFKLNNLPCNIDLHHEFLDGLITLEIEFLTVADAENFIIPEFLNRHIKAEITEDERYKNKNLALFGLPEMEFNIAKAISIIDQNESIKLVFPSSLRAIDAARVMFFQIYKLVQIHKEIYLETSDEEALHQFRINLRKTRSLLKILPGIFDEKTTAHFNKNFKLIANSTNKKRDIDVFLEFLKEQKNSKLITQILLLEKQNLNSDIKEMMSSETTQEIFKDWEVFLKEESDFYKGEKFDTPVKKLVARAFRVQILRVKKALLKLNEECANERFHATRIEIKRLRYLLEIFIDLYAIKSLEKAKERAKEIQEIFGDLQDRDIWLEILEQYLSNELLNAQIPDKLQTKIYKQIYKLRDKILDKKGKFIRTLSKVSRNLKIYYN